MINVIKTHIYGRMPHDVYTIEFNSKNGLVSVTITEPTLEAFQKALGDKYVPQRIIPDALVKFAEVTGVSISVEDEIGFAKKEVLKAIDRFDSSSSINEFQLDGFTTWFDKATRASLIRRLEAEKAAGVPKTTIWHQGIETSIDVDAAIRMLNHVEIYACQCYDTTSRHKVSVEKMSDVSDIAEYNYHEGYPEKISFWL